MIKLKAVVEALLFASQKPLTLKEITDALKSAAEYFTEGAEASNIEGSDSDGAARLNSPPSSLPSPQRLPISYSRSG